MWGVWHPTKCGCMGPVRRPYSPCTGCLQYINTYEVLKHIMHALKLKRPVVADKNLTSPYWWEPNHVRDHKTFVQSGIVWCRRKQQKRGPGEKPEVAAPKWSPIPTTAVTWIPVSEPRGKLSSGHLSGVGFGWYLARISLQLVPACWCSYPLVVRRDFAFIPCVFCVCSLRFST